MLDFRRKTASVFDQVPRRERENSMVLCQVNEVTPVDDREIPIRNTLDALRRQIRSGQFAQELEFILHLRPGAGRGKLMHNFGHGSSSV